MSTRSLFAITIAAALWLGAVFYFTFSAAALNPSNRQAQVLAQAPDQAASPRRPGSSRKDDAKKPQPGLEKAQGAHPTIIQTNILFAKAILEVFGSEQIWADGSGNQYKIDVYRRNDGGHYRMMIDWDTKDIPTSELDKIAAYKACCSLRVNGSERSAEITRFGQRHVRTAFNVPDSWPIKVELWMRPPPGPTVQKQEPGGGVMSQTGGQKKLEKVKPAADKFDIKTRSDYKYISAGIQIAANRFDFFERYLYPTFQHARCTTCHAMGSTEAIKSQHVGDGVIQVQSLDVKPDNPQFCTSCHGDLKDSVGQFGNFADTLWRSPAFQKNINWKTKKDAQDICTTVVSHLNTKEKLHTHFHSDARIAWAAGFANVVTFGVGDTTPHQQKKQPAPPGTFAAFLQRTDKWGAIGAPCAQ